MLRAGAEIWVKSQLVEKPMNTNERTNVERTNTAIALPCPLYTRSVNIDDRM